MDFSKRKLPLEATSQLRMCPVETIKPFALMISPVYVFMRRNEKFISIKSPLDFFTPEELHRLRSIEMFFMPQFVDNVLPFRNLARRVKMVLGWNPVESAAVLPPAPYELADGALRMMAPLWGRKYQLEPFFVSVFINELCALLPGEELMAAREKDFLLMERAIITSAWMVFLSLHVGAADQKYLDTLRLDSFRKVLGTDKVEDGVARLDSRSDAGELFRVVSQTLVGENLYQPLGVSIFSTRTERVAQKIIARLNRIRGENLLGKSPLEGTIYGEKGFADG